MRWWWNGNRVTSGEALRELDVLKNAGIGGVEINAIAMPSVPGGDPDAIAPALEWLSPEWNEVVKATAQGARERGMLADLIIGSGWPFGGRFLEPGEMLQLVTVQKHVLKGPGVFRRSVEELTRGDFRTWDPVRREEVPEGLPTELRFLRLVPSGSVETGRELLPDARREDVVEFPIPAGEFVLYAGSWREGFRIVVRGAPGADGPVVDHFNRESVLRYLDRVSGRLAPALGGRLGDHFRAVFCDSLELGEANWTGDFAQQFMDRRGYDPLPWLHYMADADQPEDGEPGADLRRRLRYDFNRTIAELFEERFLQTLADWAHANGVKARVQAYGREVHSLEGAMLADLPEGETWIWGGEKTPFPTAGNRFVASAAHLAGRPVVSAESMTNTVTTFRTLPYQLKQTGDLTLLSGVNHFILHGFNFSPPEAGFPGWVQYGSYFSEHNTWWPYMKHWADYAARVSWVLQNSTSRARVAVLSPDLDVWSEYGRPYYPFPEREAPLYVWRLWESFHSAGFNTDYISERILLEGKLEEGTLGFGDQRYEVVVSPGLKRMSPAAARRLAEFVEAGGRAVFMERVPDQGASYVDLGEGDRAVREALARVSAGSTGRVVQAEAPPETGTAAWALRLLEGLGIDPDVRFESPVPDISQLHQRAGDRDVFLLVHSGLSETAQVVAEFPAQGGKTAWRWDPEKGDRSVFPRGEDGRYRIRMSPLESLLLVFEPGPAPADAPVWEPLPEPGNELRLEAPWALRFQNGVTGESWEESLPGLADLASGGDPRRESFSGTVTYTLEFQSEEGAGNWLDLGEVHGISEVRLNGRDLGVRWYGQHRYLLDGALQRGANRLEVKVTNSLCNYARSAKENAVAQRWASWFPVEPAGLVGPVRVY